jgi:hypothetical protein
METFDIHKWQSNFKNKEILKEEIHTPSSTDSFNRLVKLLQASIQQAKKVHKDGQDNPENYEGSEGVDIGLLLEQVWNAFSTGNEDDKMYRDEIFK